MKEWDSNGLPVAPSAQILIMYGIGHKEADMLQNEALRMATAIFEAGRIDNPDDWDEMEGQLSFDMDEQGIEGEDRKIILNAVKERWYGRER